MSDKKAGRKNPLSLVLAGHADLVRSNLGYFLAALKASKLGNRADQIGNP